MSAKRERKDLAAFLAQHKIYVDAELPVPTGDGLVIQLWPRSTTTIDDIEKRGVPALRTAFAMPYSREVEIIGDGSVAVHLSRLPAPESVAVDRIAAGWRDPRISVVDAEGRPARLPQEQVYGPLRRVTHSSGSAWLALMQRAKLATSTTSKAPGGQVTEWQTPPLRRIVMERSGAVLVLGSGGRTAHQWNAAQGALAEALHAPDLAVVPTLGNGEVRVELRVADPLAGDFKRSRPLPYDALRGVSPLGMASDGSAATLRWAGNSGMVIGGVPGSGKTGTMTPIFAGLAGAAELHVFDGKGSHDLMPLAPISRTFDRTIDLDAAADRIGELVDLMRARMEAIFRTTGVSNFWDVDPQARARFDLYPVFTVLDECQSYLDDSGMEKEETPVVARIRKAVRTLIQQGRSAGMVTVLTTQKPEAGSIPTVIRDICGIRLCLRTSTTAQSITALGAIPDGAPDPAHIAPGQIGRAVTYVEGAASLALVQTWFVPREDVAALLADAQPVPDQAEVVARLLGHDTPPAPDTSLTPDPALVTKGPTTAPEPTAEVLGQLVVQMRCAPDDLASSALASLLLDPRLRALAARELTQLLRDDGGSDPAPAPDDLTDLLKGL